MNQNKNHNNKNHNNKNHNIQNNNPNTVVMDETLHDQVLRYALQQEDPKGWVEGFRYLTALCANDTPNEFFVKNFVHDDIERNRPSYVALLRGCMTRDGGYAMGEAVGCLVECCRGLRGKLPSGFVVAVVEPLFRVLTEHSGKKDAALETWIPACAQSFLAVPEEDLGKWVRASPEGSGMWQLRVLLLNRVLVQLPNDREKGDAVRGVVTLLPYLSLQDQKGVLRSMLLVALSFHSSIQAFPDLRQSIARYVSLLIEHPVMSSFAREEVARCSSKSFEIQQMYGLR